MPTSGVVSFNPDILDLIEDAYEMIGMELRGGYDLKTARRSLDMLMREWGNRGINMWTLKRYDIPIAAGTNTVTLTGEVIDLLDATWRTGTDIEQNDRVMTRLGGSQWTQIANKNQPGAPSQFYVHRVVPPLLRVWPTPVDDGLFVCWGLRSMEDAGAYTNTADIPTRFLPALVSGLAYYLAIKSPNAAERIPMLQQEYERQYTLAAEEDRDRSSFVMVPDMSSYNR
jgi:uncharacterized protein YihD (DUF1040 family)